ncbi:hypothetical protein [Thiomicrospira pelophila]|uniref:hypothetical protein n=1 Tax=Thiomicrospira pelophila TaxID=934 RepID=UPI0004A6AAAA|nr:hypothetical protein [Thiomicrospira pelophila]
MKREVEREKNLPAFELDIVELGVLVDRLVALFDNPDSVRCSIDFKLKNEFLEFDSVEEIKNYKELKGKVNGFVVRISRGDKVVSIRTYSFIRSLVTVSAKADNEAWCAGAIETVYSFISSHRTWYYWFVKWPLGTMLLAMVLVPTVLATLGYEDVLKNEALSTAWLLLVLFLWLIFISSGRLLPVATLRITNEDGFIRRRAPELSLAIALLTTVLTVAGWFLGG